MADKPYFAIVKSDSPEKYEAAVNRATTRKKEQPKIAPFGLEDMIPVDTPKSISGLEWYELCDELREKFPRVEQNGNVANAFTGNNFVDHHLIQFYKIPSE